MAAVRSQGVRESFLEEVTPKLRLKGKQKLAKQGEKEATVFHMQKVLGPGVKLKSVKRQGWEWADGRKALSVALGSLVCVCREIGNYGGF